MISIEERLLKNPFMPSAMPDVAAPVEENYSVASDEINYQQSERLVQKILNRKK